MLLLAALSLSPGPSIAEIPQSLPSSKAILRSCAIGLAVAAVAGAAYVGDFCFDCSQRETKAGGLLVSELWVRR